MSAVPPAAPTVTDTLTCAVTAADAVAATRTVCAPPPSATPVTGAGVGCPSVKLNVIVGNDDAVVAVVVCCATTPPNPGANTAAVNNTTNPALPAAPDSLPTAALLTATSRKYIQPKIRRHNADSLSNLLPPPPQFVKPLLNNGRFGWSRHRRGLPRRPG